MKGVTIFPSSCIGNISAPASKSAVQRAMALALLHQGKTIISNAGNSEDENVSRRIIQFLGANIHRIDAHEEHIFSLGEIKPIRNDLPFSESGLSFRMFTPIAALSPESFILNASGTLLHRPMHFFSELFPILNVKVKSNKGFPPFQIQGPLMPKSIQVPGDQSSQYLTGLLFAFAKAAMEPVKISVSHLKSKPYIDLSLEMLAYFGFSVRHQSYHDFFLEPANPRKEIITYNAEGDWSGAAFLLVAGAICGSVAIQNLRHDSLQADRRILLALQQVGADISWEADVLRCIHQELKPFEFDATDCPDLFPPLAALAAYCQGESVILGRSRLATKESNREVSIVDVLTRMGIKLIVQGDAIRIFGGKILPAKVSSHQDHRIAMMASILGLGASGPVEIEGTSAVRKSYPDFFSDLQKLSVKLNIHE